MSRSRKTYNKMTGPPGLRRLACDLQELIGDRTYEQVAYRANLSPETVSKACQGERRPTWEVTSAIVCACGQIPAEWKKRWEAAHAACSGSKKPNLSPGRFNLDLLREIVIIVAAGVIAAGTTGASGAEVLPSCDDIGGTKNGDQRWVESFRAAYERAGGRRSWAAPCSASTASSTTGPLATARTWWAEARG